ncbi:MAG: hypothetical protein ABIN13_13925, partial [Mucilaginibacter sp.]
LKLGDFILKEEKICADDVPILSPRTGLRPALKDCAPLGLGDFSSFINFCTQCQPDVAVKQNQRNKRNHNNQQ